MISRVGVPGEGAARQVLHRASSLLLPPPLLWIWLCGRCPLLSKLGGGEEEEEEEEERSVYFLSAGQNGLFDEGEDYQDSRPLAPLPLGEVIRHDIVSVLYRGRKDVLSGG